mmetsp:Transcript_31479/g.77120  ORF Transcript_31479/g.77120 Transcript_31479/m.77120 type:complete len:143 (+) Transcript_31479:132-560(+)
MLFAFTVALAVVVAASAPDFAFLGKTGVVEHVHHRLVLRQYANGTVVCVDVYGYDFVVDEAPGKLFRSREENCTRTGAGDCKFAAPQPASFARGDAVDVWRMLQPRDTEKRRRYRCSTVNNFPCYKIFDPARDGDEPRSGAV